jgi:hypothetical protein
MPWYKSTNPNWASEYRFPKVISDDTMLGRNIHIAKAKRAETMREREAILKGQKELAEMKDYVAAKWVGGVASDLLKQYRGWDACIKLIEMNEDVQISEQIAPYVDRAFNFLTFPPFIDTELKTE